MLVILCPAMYYAPSFHTRTHTHKRMLDCRYIKALDALKKLRTDKNADKVKVETALGYLRENMQRARKLRSRIKETQKQIEDVDAEIDAINQDLAPVVVRTLWLHACLSVCVCVCLPACLSVLSVCLCACLRVCLPVSVFGYVCI